MIGRAAALLAVDPAGLGGMILHGPASPLRTEILQQVESLWPAASRRRIPAGISDDRLFGGLDLPATIQQGRPVYQPGILTAHEPGVLTLPSSERATGSVVTGLMAMLDANAGNAVLALDESEPDEARTAAALRERLAFMLPLPIRPEEMDDQRFDQASVAAAHERLPRVIVTDSHIETVCRAGLALGTGSARAELLTLKAAAASAALNGQDAITEEDLALAAALVLAPRATRIPEQEPEQPANSPEAEAPADAESAPETQNSDRLPDRILAAARAALPADLLKSANPASGHEAGRGGGDAPHLSRGRRIGVRPGQLRRGARLDLVETLRAAAPWQALRRNRGPRFQVRPADFRIQRRRQQSGTTVIVAVDASGSSALHRLAEAKGAIELLLADSYARRDRVALISFRGTAAEIVLPPTRSLARARRTLTGLPGGGGTPLAAALVTGQRLSDQVRRERNGGSALFVLLTDARANVALSGSGGRTAAEQDARHAARALAAAGMSSILIDTSPRPSAFAAELAGLMGGNYLPLPFADARQMSNAVRGLAGAGHATSP